MGTPYMRSKNISGVSTDQVVNLLSFA